MNSIRLKQYVGVFGLASVLALTSLLNVSDAEHKLKSLKEPLTIELKTAIDGLQTEEGARFSGTLVERYIYEHDELPAGTDFEGVITKTRQSHHLGLPGYVALDVEQAILPNNTVVRFEKSEHKTKKVFHEKANTPKKIVKNAVPFVLINAITTVPINLLTTLPGFPFGVASKMVLGTVREFRKGDKSRWEKPGQKVGYGILVGTGLPGAVFTLSKRPEPNLSVGETVQVYLEPDGLRRLFAVDKSMGAIKSIHGKRQQK